MEITAILKDSLKYPKKDLKNSVIFAGFILLTSILLVCSVLVTVNSVDLNKLDAIDPTNLGFMELISYVFTNVSLTGQIGFIIFMILAFIVFLIILGYIYRIFENSVNNLDTFPQFNDFKLMIIQGLKIFAVSVVYFIVPCILTIINSLVNQVTVNLILGVINLIFYILIFLTYPMAIAKMTKENNLKSAFNFKEVFNITKSIGFMEYIGTLVLEVVIITIIDMAFFMVQMGFIFLASFGNSYVVTLVSLIFFVLELILNAYLVIFSSRVYGLLFNESKNI